MISIFGTPILMAENLGVDIEEAKIIIEQLKHLDPNGRRYSNIGGWQSQDLKPKTLENVDLIMLNLAKSYIEKMGGNPRKLKIGDSWVNINGLHNYNNLHIHPGSLLSGVYYLHGEDGQGSLVLQSGELNQYFNGLIHVHTTDANNLNNQFSGTAVTIPPITDSAIIFPSYVLHSVEPNSIEKERVSIAYNFIWGQ